MGNYCYFEAIRDICTKISDEIKANIYGKINVHYDNFSDTLRVRISNRAFNGNEFEMNLEFFSKEIHLGTSANVLANYILSEYRDYVEMYFWRKYRRS